MLGKSSRIGRTAHTGEARLELTKAAPDVLSLEVRRLERDVLERLRDLRGVLHRNPTRAREALEGLLADKLTFTPTETAGGKRYGIRGRLAVGGLLRLPAALRMIASPEGFENEALVSVGGNQRESSSEGKISTTDTPPNPATSGSADEFLTLSAIDSAIVRATLEGRGALAETLADMLRRRLGNQPSNVVPIRRK